MEISEDHPSENKQRLFIQSPYSKEVSHHHLHVAETQKQVGELKSFAVYIKKGFECVLMRSCWHGEAGGRPTGSETSYVLV